MPRRAVNENDRRTRYTKNVIREAYVELLDGLPPESVTVTEVCKRAEINRGTFYLHYECLPQVMEDLENAVYDEIVAFINKSLADEKNRQSLSDDFFVKWFQNGKIQKILFDSYYTKRLNEKVIDYAESLLTELCVETGRLNKTEAALFASFMVNACLKSVSKLRESPKSELIERSAFVNKLVKALFDAVIDPYEINTTYKKRLNNQ